MLLISIPHHKFQWLSSILFLWWGQWYTLAHTRPTHCVLEQPGLVFLVESWWSETPRKQEQVRLSKHRSAHPSQSGALNLPFVTVTSVPSRQPLPSRPLLLSALSVRTLTSQEIHVQRRQESGVELTEWLIQTCRLQSPPILKNVFPSSSADLPWCTSILVKAVLQGHKNFILGLDFQRGSHMKWSLLSFLSNALL